MPASVRERAYRTLRPLGSYRSLGQVGANEIAALGALTNGTEEIIGVYLNAPPTLEGGILITSRGIYVLPPVGPQFLPYDELEEIIGPGEADPRDATGITVKLKRGATAVIPVRGGNDAFRDAWEFMRFLLRVHEDQTDREA